MGNLHSRARSATKGKPLVLQRGSARVTLYRQVRNVGGKEYPQTVVAWFSADGKRRRKAFSEPEEARSHAEATVSALSRGDAAALGFTGTDATLYHAACERLSEWGVSLTEAVAEYTDFRRKLPPGVSLSEVVADFARRHPAGKRKSVSEVLTEFVADRERAGCSKVHLADIQGRLGRFAAAFQVPVHTVTAPMVKEWVRSLKNSRTDKGPLSVRSAQNVVRLIGSLFHFARREKLVSRELAEEIAEIDLGRSEPTETGIFTPQQMAALLAHCPPDLIAPLSLGAFCGIRLAELARLDWKSVDLQAGFVRIEAGMSKTAARRLVPIPENLRQWLTPVAKAEGPINPSEGSSGLNHRLVRGPAKAARVKWVKNGLRHSFCSYRLAQTSSAAQVALEAGNSPTMVFRHYRELVTPEQAAAWFGIFPA